MKIRHLFLIPITTTFSVFFTSTLLFTPILSPFTSILSRFLHMSNLRTIAFCIHALTHLALLSLYTFLFRLTVIFECTRLRHRLRRSVPALLLTVHTTFAMTILAYMFKVSDTLLLRYTMTVMVILVMYFYASLFRSTVLLLLFESAIISVNVLLFLITFYGSIDINSVLEMYRMFMSYT